MKAISLVSVALGVQCIRDGKSIIIEGLHIDPGIYLAEFGGQPLPAASQQQQQPLPQARNQQQQQAAQQPGEQRSVSYTPNAAEGSPTSLSAAGELDGTVAGGPPSHLLRSLSFGDAAYRHGAEYEQQSPWRHAAAAVGRPRPGSAQAGARAGGQVTFMLRRSMSAALCPQITAGREVDTAELASDGGTTLPSFCQPAGLEAGSTGRPSVPCADSPREKTAPGGDASSQAPPAEVAAGAAASAAAGPVFVPVVLSVPEDDYESLACDWYADQRAAVGGSGTSDKHQAEQKDGDHFPEVLHRLRVLQHHLETRECLGVPVVSVSAGGFLDAADRLHEYVLSSLELVTSGSA